ncbi:MAG: cell wall-binding repeat-containing protein [[Eubacterium] sulci]|nr:cell wall-binding repeat-containing protein [[Eubacterium] sulci]
MADRRRGSKKWLTLLLSLFMILSLIPTSAFAEVHRAPASGDGVDVQFSFSHDENFVVAKNHSGVSSTPMAKERVRLKYFDLANYGLEKFYFHTGSYGKDDEVKGTAEIAEGHITLLHLYIYMAEVYYMGIDPDDVGQGALREKIGTELFSASGKAGSMYLTSFLNFDSNLNYYVNGEFPQASEGWGATADQIELKDGDDVQIGHFTNTNFFGSKLAGFNALNCKEEVNAGEKLSITAERHWQDLMKPEGSGTGIFPSNVSKLSVIKASDFTHEKISECNAFKTLDKKEDGSFELDTTGMATGRYFIAMEGQKDPEQDKIVSTPAVAILDVTGTEDEKPEEKFAVSIKGMHGAQIKSGKLYTYKNGVKGSKNILEGVSLTKDGWVLQYETELSAGDYWFEAYGPKDELNGGIKISFTKENNSVTVHRIYDFNVGNSGWVKDRDYTIDVKLTGKDGEQRVLTLGHNEEGAHSFVFLHQDTIDVTLTPIGEKAKTHTSVKVSKSGRDTEVNTDIRATMPEVSNLTITAPKGSKISAGFGDGRNYYKYNFVEPELTETSDGVVAKFKMAKGQSKYFYRVQNPNGVTYWAFPKNFNVTEPIKVTEKDLHIGDSSYQKDTVYRFDKNVHDMANVYINVNQKGFLEMAEGGSYELNCVRNWQPIENFMNSKIAIPDFHYEVIDENGNTSDVVSVTADKNNSAVAKIKANHSGTAIVLVKYDAVIHSEAQGGTDFSAIWPELTGVFMVKVGDNDSSIETNMNINRGVKMLPIDSEHDTLYYLKGEDGASYSFKPEAGSTVSVNRGVVGDSLKYKGFTTDGVKLSASGEVTISKLTTGRHIVKVEKGSKVTYQVINAREISYEILDANGHKVADTTKLKAGDKISIQFKGLLNPVEKLAGVYNRNTAISYKDKSGKVYKSVPGSPFGVYDFSGNPKQQLISLTIPANLEDEDFELVSGCLESNGFGSNPGSHRNLTYSQGLNPNLNADTVSGNLSSLPNIKIKLTKNCKIEFVGSGIKELEGENPRYCKAGSTVSFKINKKELFKYNVSVNGIELDSDENGVYELTGDFTDNEELTVKIEKTIDEEALEKKIADIEKGRSDADLKATEAEKKHKEAEAKAEAAEKAQKLAEEKLAKAEEAKKQAEDKLAQAENEKKAAEAKAEIAEAEKKAAEARAEKAEADLNSALARAEKAEAEKRAAEAKVKELAEEVERLKNENEKGLERIAGATRFETSMAIADKLKEKLGVEKFDNIVITNGEGFADALSATYLAKVKNAPILIVNESTADEISEYVKKNAAENANIYIIGGEGAVSKKVADKMPGKKIRLRGESRFETNLEVLKAAGVEDQDIAFCNAYNFADALSVSAAGKPVMLVDNSLDSAQIVYLKTLKSKKFYLIGGQNVVSKAVENEASKLGKIERIAGSDRFATSRAVAEKFFTGEHKKAYLTYGFNFPDGLCAGVLCAVDNSPLLLVSNENMEEAAAYVTKAKVQKCIVLGGDNLISSEAASKLLKK